MRIAAFALAALLAACTHSPAFGTSWHPASAAAPTNQIASEAIEIGEEDVAAILAAGGALTGTLRIKLPREAVLPAEVAYFGGTHYALTGETSAAQRYRVWRVPAASWPKLPAALRPAR